MRLSNLFLGNLASSVAAVNLYVSSYAGNITSIQLTGSPGSYSLKAVAFTDKSMPNPSILEKSKDVVYCVDEGFATPNGSIQSYKTSASGALTLIDKHVTLPGPVSIATYNEGKGLAIAHYSAPGVSSYTINADGGLTLASAFTFKMAAPGPVVGRQEAPHPHEVILDPTGAYMAVPDLGADLIRILKIDPKTNALTATDSITMPAGSGPRHGAFMKADCGKTYFFIISELSNTIASYDVTYTPTGLAMKEIFISGTYGTNKTPPGAAAGEAILSPDKKFLVTSSRNATSFLIKSFDPKNNTLVPSDSLQTWKIDDATGKLSFVQLSPSGGKFPRQFSFNKNGTMAAVGSQQSARVVIIARDAATGEFKEFLASIDVPGEVSSVVWDE